MLKREPGLNIYGVLEKLTLPKCAMLLQSYTRKDLINLDMKYIDADQIRAEIKRLDKHYLVREYDDGWNNALNAISKFLDTLSEQPVEGLEVDLEKEIEDYCGTYENRPVPDFIEAVAHHFYELGLNARKEDK